MGFCNKYRRKDLLSEPADVPTQSEVRRQLGSPLAEIFFASVYPPCRKYLGLDPLQGVVESQLWMSPSDILIGKVMMTPPMPTRRVVRALTHQGIMEIGDRCLYKMENECRLDKQQALCELEAHMKSEALNERDKAVRAAVEEQRERFDIQLEDIYQQCRQDVKDAVRESELLSSRRTAEIIQRERREVEELMSDKMQWELETQEMLLVKTFNRHLEETIREINKYFRENMRLMMAECKWRFSLEVFRNEQFVSRLRYQMQSQRLTDVAAVTCRERQRCHDDKHRIQQDFQAQLAAMHKLMEKKITELETQQQLSEQHADLAGRWEDRVTEIVTEFQRFIHYSLDASPAQAEFLLSLQRLLVLEIRSREVVVKDTQAAPPAAAPSPAPEPPMAVDTLEVIADEEETSLHDYTPRPSPSALACAQHLLTQLVAAATPANTELQEVIGSVLEELINNAIPLPEDVVSPIVAGLVNAATPAPEQEQVVSAILQSLLRLALPMPEHEQVVSAVIQSLLKLVVPRDNQEDESTQAPALAEAEDEEEVKEEAKEVEKEEEIVEREKEDVQHKWMTCLWCEASNNKELLCDQDKKPTARSEATTQTVAVEEPVSQVEPEPDVAVPEQPVQTEPHDRVASLLQLFHQHPSLMSTFIQ